MTTETSYDNLYGTGDRRDLINAHTDISTMPDVEELIDGKYDNVFIPKISRNKVITFTPKRNELIYIDEIKWFGANSPSLVLDVFINGEYIKSMSNGGNHTVSFSLRKFKKIEIKVSNQTSESQFIIRELEIKNYVVENKILIKKDDQYGYYGNGSFQSLGVSYPTKEQFKHYGMSDLSTLEAGNTPVEYEMELISETDKEKCFSYSFDLNGQHKNMKSIDGIITE